MIDFSNGAIDLKNVAIVEIQNRLSKEFPASTKIIPIDGRQQRIKIKKGLWHCVTLYFSNDNNKTQLTGYQFTMPSFLSILLLFGLSLLMLSIILTAAVSGSVGEFTPMIVMGGAASFGFTSVFRTLIVKNVMKSWLPKIETAVNSLKS